MVNYLLKYLDNLHITFSGYYLCIVNRGREAWLTMQSYI